MRINLLNTSPTASSNWQFLTDFDGFGNYTVRGIPAGSYRIYLQPDDSSNNNYVPEIYNNIQCNLCSTLAYQGTGTVFTLVDGSTLSGINFTLETGASIEGRLLNNDGVVPLQDFGRILIFNDSNQLIGFKTVSGLMQDPSADGSYFIGGLLPGSYFAQGGDAGRSFFVRQLYSGLHCPWSGCDRGGGGTPINLGLKENHTGINFLLAYGGMISGQVTDFNTGLPIVTNQSQWIQVYDTAGKIIGGGFVNETTGEYKTARAIPAGTYSVRTGSMFYGEFTPDYVMEKYNAVGNLACPGVSCDLSAVNVVVNNYNPSSGSADPEADATTSGIDFALQQGFSFSGIITDLSTLTPLPDVHVLVYNVMGDFAHWATTNAFGQFRVSGLPAGTYYAKTNNGSGLPFMGIFPSTVGTWVDILYDSLPCPGSTCDVTTGTPIILGATPFASEHKGEPQFLFNLPTGGTFSGRLIHSQSFAGIANTQVNVYNSFGEFYGAYESNENGEWSTSGLPVDSYFLTTQGMGGMVDIKFGGDYCFVDECDPLTADPIVLGGTYNISNINMILKPDFIFRAGMD